MREYPAGAWIAWIFDYASSPASSSSRTQRSIACCDPLTTITCSAEQWTPRERATYAAISLRSGAYPAGSRA